MTINLNTLGSEIKAIVDNVEDVNFLTDAERAKLASLSVDMEVGEHTHEIVEVNGLQTALDEKAGSSHSHSVADVTGLQDELDNKAVSSHSHTAANISDFTEAVQDIIGAMIVAAGGTYNDETGEITLPSAPEPEPEPGEGDGTAVFSFSDFFDADPETSGIWDLAREEAGGVITYDSGNGRTNFYSPGFDGTNTSKAVLDRYSWNGETGQPGDTVIAKSWLRLDTDNTSDIFIYDFEHGVSPQPGIRVRTKNGAVSLERDKLNIPDGNVQGTYNIPADTWVHVVVRVDLQPDDTGRCRIWCSTDGATYTLSVDDTGPTMPIPGTSGTFDEGETPFIDYFQFGQTAGVHTSAVSMDADELEFTLYRGTAPDTENPA